MVSFLYMELLLYDEFSSTYNNTDLIQNPGSGSRIIKNKPLKVERKTFKQKRNKKDCSLYNMFILSKMDIYSFDDISANISNMHWLKKKTLQTYLKKKTSKVSKKVADLYFFQFKGNKDCNPKWYWYQQSLYNILFAKTSI